MKSVLSGILSVVAVAALTVCCATASLPQKLDTFVDDAELQNHKYSAKDWEKSQAEYNALLEEFLSSDDEYSDAERQMAARAIGRYHSLLVKNGLEESTSYISDIATVLPAYVEGLAEGFGENLDQFAATLEKILDNEELQKSFENFGKQFEKFGEQLEKLFEDLDD